jgi:hypothetical protein
MKVYEEESPGLFTGAIYGRKKRPNDTVSSRHLDVSDIASQIYPSRHCRILRDVLSRFHPPGVLLPSSVCVHVFAVGSISVLARVCFPERNSRLECAPPGILSDMLSPSQHFPQFVLDCSSMSPFLAVVVGLAVFECF